MIAVNQQTMREKWRAYRNAPRERIGFWFGLLLLVAPVFYLLLWWKPYSVKARTIWGIWLGLMVFVKLGGFAQDPIVDITNTLSPQALQAAREQNQSSRVRPKTQKTPTLDAYLAKLEGGALGTLLRHYEVRGKHIDLQFGASDGFLGSLQDIANLSVGVLYGMFYGRDFTSVCLHYTFRQKPLYFGLAQPDFNAFFSASPSQMRAFGQSQQRFDNSPLRNLTPTQRQQFLTQFSTTKPISPC